MALSLLLSSLWGADVTGNWDAQVETSAGGGSPSFVLKQEGEKLTGSYAGALGEAKVTGTVKGDAIEFSFEVSPQGEKVMVVYKGTVKGPKAMAGTVVIENFGDGTWTAVKR